MNAEAFRGTICQDELATKIAGEPYLGVRSELVPLGLTDLLDNGHTCAKACRRCNQVSFRFGVDQEGNVEISDDESRVYCTLALARATQLNKAAAQ